MSLKPTRWAGEMRVLNNILGIKFKQLQRINIVRVILTTYVLFTVLVWPLPAGGASIAEGYPAENNIVEGALVSLSDDTPPKVQLAHLNNGEYLIGVIENSGQSLLTLNKTGAKVIVATSGEVVAFVSNLGGDIKPGDFIGPSWINGVGMRAEAVSEQKLVGVALRGFDADSPNTVSVPDVETDGGKQTAIIGKIPVKLFDKELGPEGVPQPTALEQIVTKLVGRPVSFARTVAASALFIISVVIAGVFLANAIRSSLISIGRNPLSHSPIFNTLTQIAGVAIGLVLIGAAVAYVILII